MNSKHEQMNTSQNTDRVTGRLQQRAVAIASSATMAALVCVPSTAATDHDRGAYEHQCFMERPHWNIAADGPVPRCPSPEQTLDIPSDRASGAGGGAVWLGGMARVS